MLDKIQIQELKKEDLKYLAPLSPEGWGDITLVYQDHINQDYFSPIKLTLEERIIGIGELIVNGEIGWLGNIVVDKSFRNGGLGKVLTKELIEMASKKKCTSVYLLATPLGKYVYKKLGFKENGKYLFFKNTKFSPSDFISNNIFPFKPRYKKAILKLDQEAMGEDRSKVLLPHLENGWVYKEEKKEDINGFFLSTLSNGLIISNNQQAGLSLIKKRENLGKDDIALPEQCIETIDFLQQRGYKEYRQATFMYLGKMKIWNPQMVFSRIGGYLG